MRNEAMNNALSRAKCSIVNPELRFEHSPKDQHWVCRASLDEPSIFPVHFFLDITTLLAALSTQALDDNWFSRTSPDYSVNHLSALISLLSVVHAEADWA